MESLIFEEGANASVIAYLKAGIQRRQTDHEAAGSLLAKMKGRLLKEKVQPQALSPEPLVRPFISDRDLRGVHPEVVERLWQLNTNLPVDCRAVVYGSPALVQPSTDVIFAFGGGTVYFLRLRREFVEDAIQAGCFLHHKWSFGAEMHIQRELGWDWVGGRWVEAEPSWCRASFEHFGVPL